MEAQELTALWTWTGSQPGVFKDFSIPERSEVYDAIARPSRHARLAWSGLLA